MPCHDARELPCTLTVVACPMLRPRLTCWRAPCADVKFLADQGQLVTAGADKTVRIWTAVDGGSEYSAAAVMKDHTGEVRLPSC